MKRKRRSTFPTIRSPCRTCRVRNSLRLMPPTARESGIEGVRRPHCLQRRGIIVRRHPKPSPLRDAKKAFAIAGYDESARPEKILAACCTRSRSARRRTAALRPRYQPHCHARVVRRGEPARSGAVPYERARRGIDLMGAPSEATPKQLRELHIRVVKQTAD